MRLNDPGRNAVKCAEANVRAHPRQRRETLRVVGPIQSVRTEVGIAGTVIEMRRVENEQVETGGVARQNPRRAAEQIIVDMRGLSVASLANTAG